MGNAILTYHPKIESLLKYQGRICCPMCRTELKTIDSDHLKDIDCPWRFVCWSSSFDKYKYNSFEMVLHLKDYSVSTCVEYEYDMIFVRPFIDEKIVYDNVAARIPMFDIDLTDMEKFQNKIKLYLTLR